MPYCREHLHTSADIPRSFAKTQKTAQALFRNVDTETYFSEYENKDYWFIEEQEQTVKEQIMQQIQKDMMLAVKNKIYQSVHEV